MQRAAAALTLKKLLPRDLPRGKRTRPSGRARVLHAESRLLLGKTGGNQGCTHCVEKWDKAESKIAMAQAESKIAMAQAECKTAMALACVSSADLSALPIRMISSNSALVQFAYACCTQFANLRNQATCSFLVRKPGTPAIAATVIPAGVIINWRWHGDVRRTKKSTPSTSRFCGARYTIAA
jgi:hypothetical protein